MIASVVDSNGGASLIELDLRLLELRRFVRLRADLYVRSSDETALELSEEQYSLIEKHEPVLVVEHDHRLWWNECRYLRTNLWGCS